MHSQAIRSLPQQAKEEYSNQTFRSLKLYLEHTKSQMKTYITLIKPLKSVDIISKEEKLAHKERTDSCAVPAASIIAESMLCIVITDALLEKFGGDSMQQLSNHIKSSSRY